jgi:outer membrane protein assembly factor BamB
MVCPRLPSSWLIWRGVWLLVAATCPACGSNSPVEEIHPSPGATAAVPQDSTAETIEPSPDDWPCWRGVKGDGIAVGTAPTHWSATKNVLWKVEIPGQGHASPIVFGDRVFIATADEQQQTMKLLCYGREDGAQQWERQVHEGGFMHAHNKNTHASATPACDGHHVYWVAMVNDAIWVSAVSVEGELVWQAEAGPFVSMHGYGSSPVLYKNLVIVQGDSNGPGWLAALNKETGKIHWRVKRDHGASFATPSIARLRGQDQLLLSGHDKVVGYDPLTGEEIWRADGPASVTANTMAWSETLLFASGGYPQRATWCLTSDKGAVVWKKNWKCYVPSMIVQGEQLIVPQDDGIVHCVEAATGKEYWNKRLGGDLTASPVLADGKLYFTTEMGKTIVLKSGKHIEVIAENDLGQRCYATPTICGGRIYLRTFSQLYCIGENEPHAASE